MNQVKDVIMEEGMNGYEWRWIQVDGCGFKWNNEYNEIK